MKIFLSALTLTATMMPVPKVPVPVTRLIDVVRGDGGLDGAVGGPVFGEAGEGVAGVFGGVLLPVGVVVVDAVGLGVVLGFEGFEEVVDAMLVAEVGEEPAVAGDVSGEREDAEQEDGDDDDNDDVAPAVVAGGVVGGCIHQVGQGHRRDPFRAKFGVALVRDFSLPLLDTGDWKNGHAALSRRYAAAGEGEGVADVVEFGGRRGAGRRRGCRSGRRCWRGGGGKRRR